ncbi:MAG: glutamine amidotransferase [Gammaproteobacteria bacterium]|nr:glutamine amidotransferase [Gammaproteobacteria bacterium]
MSRQVLIVVHQEHSTPGRVGELLSERGYRLERRCPCLGEPLPSDLSDYAAAVVFGGPQSANDDHLPGIRAELDWLERHAIPANVPLLGICLGAQEIARVLGAKVGPHDTGLVEIGYWDVSPTDAARGFLDERMRFYQWHSETFEIPCGAEHLAGNDAFPAQAFRYGSAVYALEFHPEITRSMINRWCTSERGVNKLALPGAQPHAEQLAHHDRMAGDICRWLGRFLDGLLLSGGVREGARLSDARR